MVKTYSLSELQRNKHATKKWEIVYTDWPERSDVKVWVCMKSRVCMINDATEDGRVEVRRND